MNADDTILLVESEDDLQDAMSAMFNYCKKWKLQVNVKKLYFLFLEKDQ